MMISIKATNHEVAVNERDDYCLLRRRILDVDKELETSKEVLYDILIENSVDLNSSSQSAENSSPEEKKLIVKKKRIRYSRSRNPIFMPHLRILRRDIRRSYTEMLINSFNANNSTILAKFFSEFSLPNCVFDTKDLKEKLSFIPKSQGPPPVFVGPDLLIYGISQNFSVLPDTVFRIQKNQVRVSEQSTGSIIQALVTCEGTLVYHVDDRNFTIPGLDHVNEGIVGLPQKQSYFPIDSTSFLRDGLKWSLLPNALKTKNEVLITMKLDENYRIISFLYECLYFESETL